jgi:hypothetical protein
MGRHVSTTTSDFDRLISEFGARIDAALATAAIERARADARLDAFLGIHSFFDAERDVLGVYSPESFR